MSTEEEKISLPQNTLEQIEKIIQNYASYDESVDLNQMTESSDLSKSTISRNNGFLDSVGLIEGAKQKTVTGLGKKLGRGLEHGRKREIKKYWKKVVEQNHFLSQIVSTVSAEGQMEEKELVSEILFKADVDDTPHNRTGSRAIIGILNKAGVLEQEGENYEVSEGGVGQAGQTDVDFESRREKEESSQEKSNREVSETLNPSININLQLEIPKTDKKEIYDNLFSSLKENLLDGE